MKTNKDNINWQPNYLENELIKLIPLTEGDFETLYQIASDPLLWEQHPKKDRYKREVFIPFFEHAISRKSAFLIEEKATGKIIGSSGYYDYKIENSSIIVGYTFLARQYWGGRCNKALKNLLLDYAFQYVNKVYFHIGAVNTRSQIAIERIGAKKVREFMTEDKIKTYEYVIEKKDFMIMNLNKQTEYWNKAAQNKTFTFMNEITFHKATSNDAHILAELRIRFALELSGEQVPEKIDVLKKQMADYFTRATLENSCISFIAKSNNVVAGIGSVHIREVPGNFKNMSGKWGYIMNMYTIPEYRKQGICSEILKLLVNEGKQYGITAFELHATDEGKPVYLKGGFQIHHEPTLRKYI